MSQLRLLSRLPASISSDAERASPLRRMVIWLTLLTYLGQPLLVTAQIIADQNAAANKRPLVDVTANGLPLVQIATPSAAGVSHNQYTLFNVDPAGIILNNSQATVLTQQAGYVAANPNLANGAARIILNEVTSTNRSQLNGYTEVAGQPAEVIIANPNGITCNGCGFINTSRGVLTTGTPVLGTSGSLDAFRVTGGDIQIGTAGLNGSNLNQLDLISRSLQVNGQLWANNLNVITGANLANYNTLGVQVIPGTGNKPTVGIDVALLGGMYANKIKMVGTEVGVGVNSLGTLAAQAGDFILDNQGLITLAGNTTASGNLSVSSAAAVTSSGTLAAQGNLTLNAASLNSTGTLAAGINSTGAATGNLSITTQAQTLATGRNLSGGDLSITASNINLANSSTQARNNVTLAATANIDHSNAQTLAGQDLNLSAATLIGNGRLIAGRDANLNLQGNYTNTVGNVIKANRNLALSTTGILTNQTALEALGNLTLTAASLDNQIAATLNASNTTLNSAASITNAGRITGNNVNSTSASFSNTGSVMGNVITLNAGSLDNTGAAAFIGATQQLNLAIANSLSNKDGATLYSLGDVNIGANLAINPATGYLLGNTSSVLNSSATIEASGNLRIAANTLTNQRSVWGVMWGNTTAGAFVQGVSSYGGQGTPSYTPYFATEQFTAATTPAAQLLSGKNMLISGGMVTNTYSNMIAGAALTTQLTAPINNIGAAFITRETRVGQYNDFVMVQTGWTCNGWLCLSQSPTYGWVLNPLQYSKIIDTNASASNFTQAANTNPAIPVKPTTGNPVSVDASSAAVQAGALTLPTSGLYSINTQPGQKYLVVTDPRFTSYQNFMSSDYMFGRLSLDPQLMQKRLGDGFYEQKLINEQIAAQTGRRYLGDFSDAQTQFIALLDAGVKAAQDFQLSVGIALTPKQIDALSQDLVWMVEREVTLPNGKVERVLAPQLYLSRLHQADLKPSGALIAANSINLNSTGDINNSGSIASKNSTVLSAHDIRNQGGVIGSEGLTLLNADNDIFNLSGNINGKDVSLTAGRDIINQRTSQTVTHSMVSPAGTGLFGFPSVTQTTSGTELGLDAGITAGNNLLIKAGRDLSILGATVSSGADAALLAGRNINVGVVTSTTTANTSRYAASRSEITQLGSALTTAGNLQMQAGKDLTLTAAQLDVGKDASLNAGGNLTLAAAKNSRALSFDTGMMQKNSYDETVQGTHLNAGGNVSLTALTAQATAQTPAPSSSNGVTDTRRAVSENRPQAVGNITLQSARISSKGGAIAVQASGDVNLLGSDEQHHSYQQTRVASSGFLSSTTTTTRDETNRSLAVGSSLDGNSISIQSGKNINVTGSDVSAKQDITLVAMNDINIKAATETYQATHKREEVTNGLVGSGMGMTIGQDKQSTETNIDGATQSQSRSHIGSSNGNVRLMSGGNTLIVGSDLAAAQGKLAVAAGGGIGIFAGQDTLKQYTETQHTQDTDIFSKQKRVVTDTLITSRYQGSTLAGTSIDINAGANLVLQAAQLNSKVDTNLAAGGDLKLLSATDSTYSKHTETLQTDGIALNTPNEAFADRRKNSSVTSKIDTNQVTTINSGGNLTTRSGGNTLIEASTLNADGSIDLKAGYDAKGNVTKPDATLTFAAVKDSNYLSIEDKHSSLSWQSQSGSGHYNETVKLANIKAGKGLNVDATGGIVVDIPEVAAAPAPAANGLIATQLKAPLTDKQAAQAEADKKVQDAQRLKDHLDTLAKQPGQVWLGQLAKDPKLNVQFKQVSAAAQQWNYSHDGLTPEAAGVIVIAVTYFTAGAASGAAGAITGAAAGTTTIASAALAAGMTTLASQASLALINNKGDLGKTLDDMGKSENVKALVTAMVTAGALSQLNQAMNLSNVNAQSGFAEQLQKNLINQSSSALINHAINGGDLSQQLEQSLKSAFIDTGAAQGANLIGDLKQNGTLNDYTHKLAHAIAGCAAGAAKSNDCSSGALGAVVGEITAELYAPGNTGTPLTAQQQTDTINFTKLIAGVAAALTGNDVNVAAGAAGNAAENNWLNHNRPSLLALSEKERYDQATKDCGSGNAAQCSVATDLRNLSNDRDRQLNLACAGAPSSTCAAAAKEAILAGNDVFTGPDGRIYATSKTLPALSNQNRPQGFDQQLAPSVIDAALLEAGNGVIAGVVKGGAAALEVLGLTARGAETAADAGAGVATIRPDFYVTPDGMAVPATGYRAIGGEQNILEAGKGVVSPRDPTYLTFDNITNMPGGKIKDLLQLEYPPTHIISFDTKQILNDLTIPNGRWGNFPNPEPLTSTFPEWGAGGGTQAITNSPIKIDTLSPVVKP